MNSNTFFSPSRGLYQKPARGTNAPGFLPEDIQRGKPSALEKFSRVSVKNKRLFYKMVEKH